MYGGRLCTPEEADYIVYPVTRFEHLEDTRGITVEWLWSMIEFMGCEIDSRDFKSWGVGEGTILEEWRVLERSRDRMRPVKGSLKRDRGRGDEIENGDAGPRREKKRVSFGEDITNTDRSHSNGGTTALPNDGKDSVSSQVQHIPKPHTPTPARPALVPPTDPAAPHLITHTSWRPQRISNAFAMPIQTQAPVPVSYWIPLKG
jgi:hypothetical protein